MRWWLCLFMLAALPARAHNGVSAVQAQFTSPAPPQTTPSDMSVTLTPLTVASADASFSVTWSDGDMDPTGKFIFYYLDHQPTFAVRAEDIETIATAAEEVGKPGKLVQIYASDSCTDGPGVVCPDAGVRDARNGFMWNTQNVPAGTYWLIAINDDPPFKIYNPSDTPVRVAHGGTAPPAIVVLRPDGFGSFDKSYSVQWFATGKAPLKFDLSYGSGEAGEALNPVSVIGKDVATTANLDSTYSYDWDVSKLMGPKVYFLRVTVTDGDGKQSFSDSRYGMSVFHPAPVVDAGGFVVRDLSQPETMGCEVAEKPAGTSLLLPMLLVLLAILGTLKLST